MIMSRDKKIERFNRKYQKKGGFEKLDEMVNNCATLQEIGHFFGFSRQNAAGIYDSFFGGKYKPVQENRKEKIERTRFEKLNNLDDRISRLSKTSKRRSLKKTVYLKIVKDECERQGFRMEFSANKTFTPKLIINNNTVAVSGTDAKTKYHIPKSGNPTVYFRFAVPAKIYDYSIFILDNGESDRVFYIIPHNLIKHLTLITLRTNYDNPRKKGKIGSKYSKYKDAWYLLSKKKTENE